MQPNVDPAVLKKFLEGELKHHTTMARAHKNLRDASDDDDIQKFHGIARDSHVSQGEVCSKCLADCNKAAGSEFGKLSEMAPDQISGITPTAPTNIRPVLRAGQRDFSEAKAPVDLALEKIFAIE